MTKTALFIFIRLCLWFIANFFCSASPMSLTDTRGGTHLSEGLTGLAEKTKEQTIKQ